MMSVWKRNAVVLAIVLFVGVAVYLNWSYNKQMTGEGSGGKDGKVLGQTTLVNGVEDGQDEKSETDGEKKEETKESGYFASARLNRQQARDSALQLLQKAATDEKAAQKVVDEANTSIQTMADATLSEAQVENLVTAKGYGDCVCFLGEDNVNLVVSSTAQGLSETDVAKIVEIVRQETGLSADKIKIIQAQP